MFLFIYFCRLQKKWYQKPISIIESEEKLKIPSRIITCTFQLPDNQLFDH